MGIRTGPAARSDGKSLADFIHVYTQEVAGGSMPITGLPMLYQFRALPSPILALLPHEIALF